MELTNLKKYSGLLEKPMLGIWGQPQFFEQAEIRVTTDPKS